MRLFLSSYRFGNHAQRYGELVGTGKRIAIITNAQDVYADLALRQEKVAETIAELQEVGLHGEELDLRHYFNEVDNLAVKLHEYDGLWVRGGNSFVLRKAMRYSGFDTVIGQLLLEDKLVYGGYSAGACVTAVDMHGLDLCDEPTATPEGYGPEIVWEGLGILDYAIVPHYKSDHPESALVDKTVAYMDQHKLSYKTLHDNEVLIVNGVNAEILS
jgi:dipeptidase E